MREEEPLKISPAIGWPKFKVGGPHYGKRTRKGSKRDPRRIKKEK